MRYILILIFMLLFVSCGEHVKHEFEFPDETVDEVSNDSDVEDIEDITDEVSNDSDVEDIEDITDEVTDETVDEVSNDSDVEEIPDETELILFKETSGTRLKLREYVKDGVTVRSDIIDTGLELINGEIPCKFMKHRFEDKYRCYPYVNVFDLGDGEISDYTHLGFFILCSDYSNRYQIDIRYKFILFIRNGVDGKVVDSVNRIKNSNNSEDKPYYETKTIALINLTGDESAYQDYPHEYFQEAVEKTLE